MASPTKEHLRLGCVALMRIVLRLSCRPYLPPSGGALIVAPHADDEALGCGGLIAAQVRAGRSIEVVYLTDSAGSHPGHPSLSAPALAAMRRREALAALAVLGVGPERVHFLDMPDGTLDRLSTDAARSLTRRLEQLMRSLRPSEVFTPYRHGGSTEHTAAWRLTAAAIAASGGGTMIEYPIWAWWNPFRLIHRLGWRRGNFKLSLGSWRAVKIRALACHHSQVVAIPPDRNPVLPASLARACCGPTEFFFSSRVESKQPSDAHAAA